MHDSTAFALDAINERFYRRHASDFERTRRRPWQGWQRVRDLLPRDRDAAAAPRVLDLGCGNGRLLESLPHAIDYVGCDRSLPLLRRAATALEERPGGRGGVIAAQLLARGDTFLLLPLAEQRFDLVIATGVLHHIPGLERRRALLAAGAACVAPRGHLVFSVWQFEAAAGIEQRRLSEQGIREHLSAAAVADLETGDALLRWGLGDDAPRYCHHTSSAELAILQESLTVLGLALRAQWHDTTERGFGNLYTALERV
jgi:SAM-dependent methyltransferase